MKKFSRLALKEEKRNVRQAVIYISLTLILILGLIFFGIPGLIKIAVLLDNLRTSSQPLESQDAVPPAPPIILTTYEATNSADLSLSGFAEAGSTVEIYLNNSLVKKLIVGNDGSLNVEGLTLVEGQNEIYALATDNFNNKSAESERAIVLYDNTPPSLEITQPEDKSTYEESSVEIIGRTEPEANLFINDHLVVLDKEGNFKYTLNLSLGENAITIKAVDKAGNQTEGKLILIYSL